MELPELLEPLELLEPPVVLLVEDAALVLDAPTPPTVDDAALVLDAAAPPAPDVVTALVLDAAAPPAPDVVAALPPSSEPQAETNAINGIATSQSFIATPDRRGRR